MNLVVGFPGETQQDFEETMAFVTKIAPKMLRISSIATLDLDHSYMWDHLNEFDIVTKDKDRHISWRTGDGMNTYEIRLGRAEALVNHAYSLGLTHQLYDVDIERQDCLMKLSTLRWRRMRGRAKHMIKSGLRATHLLEPARRVVSAMHRNS